MPKNIFDIRKSRLKLDNIEVKPFRRNRSNNADNGIEKFQKGGDLFH